MRAGTIPVQDLKRHHGPLAAALRKAARRVMDSGWYVLGAEVRAFEEEFAAYLGTTDCVSVANGTDALELALRAFQIGPGDEVCTVANAGMYASSAILSVGATPVFVDVQPETLAMCPADLAARITESTRAIVVTHLYGRMADMEPIAAVARARRLPLIEDCAQAHGAQWLGRKAGTWGDLGCFSFYPTKNLGALGDGGAIATRDPQVAERLRSLRQYGWRSRYHATIPGGRNSRLDELQAAFLRVKLPQLNHWNHRRQQIASAYHEAFRPAGIRLPKLDAQAHVVHLYVIRLPQRDEFRRLLAAAGVGSDIHYPVPDYSQPAVREQRGDPKSLAETERACSEVVTLPCFPEMTEDEVHQVITAVLATLQSLGI